MSRKMFDKMKQAGKCIKKSFSQKLSAQSIKKSYSSSQKQQPTQKWIKKLFYNSKLNLDNLKDYAKESFRGNAQKQANSQKFKLKNNREQKKINLSEFFQKSFKKAQAGKQTKQALAQKIQKLKQNASQLTAGASQKFGEFRKILLNKKDKAQQFGSQASKKLSSEAEKIKNETLDKINAAAESKLNLFGKLLNKMFWKIALLIGVGLFAYGMGTSLPRQIRLLLNKQSEKESEKGNSKQIHQQKPK